MADNRTKPHAPTTVRRETRLRSTSFMRDNTLDYVAKKLRGYSGRGIQIVINTKTFWDAQIGLIAEQGRIYIYSDWATEEIDGTVRDVPAIKVGDGTTYLIDLPIVGEDIKKLLLDHINDTDAHVSDHDREFWDNKSSAFLAEGRNDTLVLSNTQYLLGGVIKNG